MANNTGKNPSIQSVYQKSFPGQHLFEVSLVKDCDQNLPFYKPRYFCFISMTPGAQGQNGRTFNREQRITMKVDCEKLLALAHSVRLYAKGVNPSISKFSIFSDSSKTQYGQGGTKSCFASPFTKKDKNGQDELLISLSMTTSGAKPFGAYWYPSEALAVGDILEDIAKYGLKLDMEHSRQGPIGNVPQDNNKSIQNPQNTFTPPQERFSPTGEVPLPPSSSAGDIQQNFEAALQNTFDGASPFSGDGQFNGMDDVPF